MNTLNFIPNILKFLLHSIKNFNSVYKHYVFALFPFTTLGKVAFDEPHYE